MAVRTATIRSSEPKSVDAERLYELLRSMRDDIKEIKERLRRIDKPINSGKDL